MKNEKIKQKTPKTKQQILIEYAKAIVTALILALFIRAYFVQAFKIPTGSMKQTLLEGDHILVNKFLFGTKLPFTDVTILKLKSPEKHDIVVFKYPEDPKRDFIKRVIATEGDTVASIDKKIFLNGVEVKESFVMHTDSEIRPPEAETRDNFGPIVVPEGKLFVMGDNRDQSYDSRYWGFVDIKAVKGKAMIIYWSWNGNKKFPRLKRTGRLVR